jgi:putative addiction module component (TIGR02574 family)
MHRSLDEVEAAALNLAPDERARLARRLLASLDDDVLEDPQAVELAWEQEVRRRLQAHLDGKSKRIPAAEVFAAARDRLR